MTKEPQQNPNPGYKPTQFPPPPPRSASIDAETLANAIDHAGHMIGVNASGSFPGALEKCSMVIEEGCSRIADSLLEIARALRERDL